MIAISQYPGSFDECFCYLLLMFYCACMTVYIWTYVIKWLEIVCSKNWLVTRVNDVLRCRSLVQRFNLQYRQWLLSNLTLDREVAVNLQLSANLWITSLMRTLVQNLQIAKIPDFPSLIIMSLVILFMFSGLLYPCWTAHSFSVQS